VFKKYYASIKFSVPGILTEIDRQVGIKYSLNYIIWKTQRGTLSQFVAQFQAEFIFHTQKVKPHQLCCQNGFILTIWTKLRNSFLITQ